MSNTNSYESPFCTRYASGEMQYIFSADKKFSTWRRLWVALARAEMKLGLPVTQKQVDQLEANIENIDYETAAAREKDIPSRQEYPRTLFRELFLNQDRLFQDRKYNRMDRTGISA